MLVIPKVPVAVVVVAPNIAVDTAFGVSVALPKLNMGVAAVLEVLCPVDNARLVLEGLFARAKLEVELFEIVELLSDFPRSYLNPPVLDGVSAGLDVCPNANPPGLAAGALLVGVVFPPKENVGVADVLVETTGVIVKLAVLVVGAGLLKLRVGVETLSSVLLWSPNKTFVAIKP